MNHTQLLNHLIANYNLKSYLEIGVRNTTHNFDKINCLMKTGVDPTVRNHKDVIPKTSDQFFADIFRVPHINSVASILRIQIKPPTYSLIFIDGLHHADQVERDFNNSLKCLNEGGFIVIHDCLPTDEITTCVPRGSQRVWHGDVYKAVMKLNVFQGIDYVTVNMDEGCCIVWENSRKTNYGFQLVLEGVNWETYKSLGKELMHVIEPSELDKYLPKVKEVVK